MWISYNYLKMAALLLLFFYGVLFNHMWAMKISDPEENRKLVLINNVWKIIEPRSSRTHTHVEYGCYRQSLEDVRLTRFQNTACRVESVLDGSARSDRRGKKTVWTEDVHLFSAGYWLTTSTGFCVSTWITGLQMSYCGVVRADEVVNK